jgi:hypothetical protein
MRLDGQLMHVITQDGLLWRTLPCPIPLGQRHQRQGVRLAGPTPLPPAAVTVQRKVSSRGSIMVATQKIQVGMTHAGKIAAILTEDHSFRLVIDGETVAVVPRTTSSEIHRYKAYATQPANPRLGQRQRYTDSHVGRPHIQAFVEALHGAQGQPRSLHHDLAFQRRRPRLRRTRQCTPRPH